jgi:hypothetical protein
MLSIAPQPKADGTATSTSMATTQSGPGGTENRDAPRRPASALPTITGLRISPHGVEATLVNISESGLLAECGERLKPGSAVTVVFEGTFTPRTIEARVARNTVASMGKDGRLRYHVGIAFTKPVSLGPDESSPANPEPEGPVLVQPPARNRW